MIDYVVKPDRYISQTILLEDIDLSQIYQYRLMCPIYIFKDIQAGPSVYFILFLYSNLTYTYIFVPFFSFLLFIIILKFPVKFTVLVH